MGGGWVEGDNEFAKGISHLPLLEYTFWLLLCLATLIAPRLMIGDEMDLG